MGWDDAPPTAEELKATTPDAGAGWTSAPPTKEELASVGAAAPDPSPDELAAQQFAAMNASDKAQNEALGNTLTFGHLPQIIAKYQQIKNGEGIANDANYVKRRDAEIADEAQTAAAHPLPHMTGAAAGLVLPMLATGGISGGGNAAESVPLLTRLWQGAKTGIKAAGTGFAYGGLQNPGDTPGVVDPLQLQAREQNAKLGAEIGGGGAIAAEGASLAAPALQSYLRSVAEKQKFKSLGPYAREAQQAYAKDGRINSIGATLLDNNIGGPLTSREAMEGQIAGATDKAGQDLGNYVSQLEQKAGNRPDLAISRQGIANQVRNNLINPHVDVPDAAAQNAQVNSLLGQFEQAPEGAPPLSPTLSPSEAEIKKRAVGQQINWNRLPNADIPLPEQVNRALYGALAQGAEKGATTLEQETGPLGPKSFGDLKNDYENLKESGKIIAQRNAKEYAKSLLSKSNLTTGVIGAAEGAREGDTLGQKVKYGALGGLAGLSIGPLTRFGNEYGNSMLASGFNNASKLAGAASQLGALAPGAAPALVNAEGVGGMNALIAAAKQNPDILKNIKNQDLRDKLQSAIDKGSDSDDSLNTAAAEMLKRPIDDETARQHYLNGN